MFLNSRLATNHQWRGKSLLPISIAGDNNDVDGVAGAKSEPVQETEVQKEDQKETPQEPAKTEIAEEKAPEAQEEAKPIETPAKTE